MDVFPDAAADAGPSFGSPPADPTAAELARRLDAVEAGLGRLGGRLEALAVSLEASFETAVATEVQAAAAELRHTVSELGRILVRDLGKLPQMLAKHRQAIVAELRGTEGPPAAVSSATRAGSGVTPSDVAIPDVATPDVVVPDLAADREPDVVREAGTDDADADADDADEPGTATDEAGADRNWRDHLRRHRQS